VAVLRSLSALRKDPRPGPTLLANLALLAAYVAAAGGMLLYSERAVDPGIWANLVPWPWVAEGIVVGAMLLAGVRLWPAVFVGSCIVWGGLRHDPPISVGIDAIGEALSLVLVVLLLRGWRFRRHFDRLRDGFVLLAAALVGRFIHGAIDIGGAWLAAWVDPSRMPADFLSLLTVPGQAAPVLRPELIWTIARWELNSVAGIVLAVPALVASRQPLARALRQRPTALAAFAALTALWCVLAVTVPYAWASWLLLLLALILVSWAAIDFGVITAALTTFALCLTTAVGFSHRIGPLAGTGTEGGLAVAWGFIALLCCTSPVLASTLAARRRDMRRLRALAERNRHIFMGNPCPAWVVDSATGRILQANDEATRRYGYSNAEFLSMTADQLLGAQTDSRNPAPAAVDLIAEPFVKHRTQGGELIDVEVASAPLEVAGRAVTLTYALEMTDRQGLRRRLLAVADRERRRLAQELHDGLGQVLTGLALGAQSLLTRARRGAVLDTAGVEFTARTVAEGEAMLAQLTEGISPLEALNGDLVQALKHLPETLPPDERARMAVIVEQLAPVALPLERREHLYRIAQEAVTNSLKHARAKVLTIRVLIDAAQIRVLIEDDGIGLRPQGQREGLGIRSMRLRAQAMAGEWHASLRAGGGTVVECACSQTEAPARPAIQDRLPGAQPTTGGHSNAARRARPGTVFKSALLALACFAGGVATAALAASQDPRIGLAGARLAIPSLMSGAAVAGLVLGGRRLWPGVLVGVLVTYLGVQRFSFGFSLAGGIIIAGAAYTMASAFRWLHFDRRFARWQDPLVLVVVAASVWSVGQFLGVSSLAFFQWLQPGSLGPAITRLLTAADGTSPHVTHQFVVASLRWWADGFAGIVLTVPAVVAMPSLLGALRRQSREATLWTLSIIAWAVALMAIPDTHALMPLLAAAILLLVWAGSRFGVALASLGTLVCAMTGAAAFALQRGALAMTDPSQGVSFIWGFLGVLTTVGLFIAALLGEQDRGRQDIRDAGEWYRRLFERDPRALWVHEAESGRVVAFNEQLLRACRLGRPRPQAVRLEDLFGSDAARTLIEACNAPVPAPVEIRQRAEDAGVIDLEVAFLSSMVDGREVYVCFAQDVTERNALRRSLVERTDVERRRLAAELRRGLATHLLKLRTAVTALERAVARDEPVVAILESICSQVRHATAACRECAHRASPLQASDGDFVAAIQNLHKYVPASGLQRVSVTADLSAPIEMPEDQAENLYELVREAVAQCVAREPKASIGVSVSTTAEAVRVAVETFGGPAPAASILSIGRESSVRLRAMAMGARLWSQAAGDGGTRLVCECLNASAA
jgi:signal transduction histidine kinase